MRGNIACGGLVGEFFGGPGSVIDNCRAIGELRVGDLISSINSDTVSGYVTAGGLIGQYASGAIRNSCANVDLQISAAVSGDNRIYVAGGHEVTAWKTGYAAYQSSGQPIRDFRRGPDVLHNQRL